MEKYKNKYRISSNRLQGWDYSSCGAYFITICTKNKEHYFGKIMNEKMNLSEIGKIVNCFWNKIPNYFSFVMLDEFVVMPNHIHGIIIIRNNDEMPIVETTNRVLIGRDAGRDAINCVSTKTDKNKNVKKGGFAGDKNPLLNNNLSRIIRWYKGRITFECRKINPNFAWQSNYYDHIIRNNQSYEKVRDYIYNNPQNWQDDKLYS